HVQTVRELALFGSVLRDDFHNESDIDVLVTFQAEARPTLFTLSDMVDELETIVGRKVDIVTKGSVEQSENYLLKREVLRTARVIYAA
ncbi:MAG: nucleotidyltransferase domain-containing protein, partial [Chloroflexota bacterium]